jgi:5-methylcytosine-specific restriction endonuclease McrA
VLVLDKSYTPTTIFSHKKAFILDVLGRCEVLEYYRTKTIRSVSADYPVPLVIRIPILLRHWKKGPTRRAIHIRDNFTCAYCGKTLKDSEITIDHIVPKSCGGKWTWKNLITCCAECNQRKGNRTPEEAGMELLFLPYVPTRIEIAVRNWKLNEEFMEILSLYGSEKIVEKVTKKSTARG